MKVVVLTGAGISAPSGISTFRDKDGLWENYDIDVIADYNTWRQNFDTVHRFYNERRTSLSTVEPNPAHYAIKKLQDNLETIVFTQNIDDLFERAGCNNIVHLHGNLKEMQCVACGNVWNIDYTSFDAGYDTCPKCASRKGVKPNVVFFNENAPHYPYFYEIIKQLTKDDVFLIIGTSGQVIHVDSLVFDCPAHKILNNLDHKQWINTNYFNETWFESADIVVPNIVDGLIKRFVLTNSKHVVI